MEIQSFVRLIFNYFHKIIIQGHGDAILLQASLLDFFSFQIFLLFQLFNCIHFCCVVSILIFDVFNFGYKTTMKNMYKLFLYGKRIYNRDSFAFKLKSQVSYYSEKLDNNNVNQQQTQLLIFSLSNPHSSTQNQANHNKKIINEKIKQIDSQCKQPFNSNLGSMLMKQGKYNEAINYFSNAWKINKSNSEYCTKIALCLMRNNNFTDAIKLLQRQLTINPKDFTIYHCLAVISFRIEDYRQSILNFHKCYQINREIPPQIAKSGQDLITKGEYSEALLFFIKLFIHNPEDKSTIIGLKNCFLFGEKVQLGKQIYSLLEQLQIHKNAVNYSLAVFNFQIGNIKQSKTYLLSALELNQDDYLLNSYIGTVYLQENYLQKATYYFNKSLKLKPYDVSVLNSLAVIYMKQKDFKKARQFYLHSLEVNQKDSIALSGVGILYLQQGSIQKGIEYLEKAIKIDQLNYPALQKLGRAYFLLGKEQEGMQLLQKAQDLQRTIYED